MEYEHKPAKRPRFDLFFSYIERCLPADRMVIYVLLTVCIAAGAFGLLAINNKYTSEVPAQGGTFTEGIVGTPRFVNPVLALTRADNDLVALIYSGLMKIDENGVLAPDLAESVTVSEDGLVYNVVLQSDITFHDGTPVEAHDVAYTIELAQNPEVKSPIRGNWSGVTVEVLGERELNLVLENPYTPFLENLTLGVMPEHIWSSLSIEELPFSQHNTEPIGSGPYALGEISRNKSGLINSYTLKAFSDAGVTPRIDTFIVEFFQNEDELMDAFAAGRLTGSAGFSYETLAEIEKMGETTIVSVPLPRVFSVFFNQNKSAALRDESARRALHAAIDRDALVATVLDGYGEPVTSPLPPGSGIVVGNDQGDPAVASLEAARTILVDGGWTENEFGRWTKEIDDVETTLAITITTSNSGVFEETAYYLEHVWSELGAEVGIELYEQSDLVQTVIRPRNYEALLFGTEIGRALDLYPFWHSSQREDPGLNVALYTNITTDALLTTARTTQDAAERTESLQAFVTAIEEEKPAIFLYSPSFVYAVRNGVMTATMHGIARPHERFSNVGEWHMRQESVWNIFADN